MHETSEHLTGALLYRLTHHGHLLEMNQRGADSDRAAPGADTVPTNPRSRVGSLRRRYIILWPLTSNTTGYFDKPVKWELQDLATDPSHDVRWSSGLCPF